MFVCLFLFVSLDICRSAHMEHHQIIQKHCRTSQYVSLLSPIPSGQYTSTYKNYNESAAPVIMLYGISIKYSSINLIQSHKKHYKNDYMQSVL